MSFILNEAECSDIDSGNEQPDGAYEADFIDDTSEFPDDWLRPININFDKNTLVKKRVTVCENGKKRKVLKTVAEIASTSPVRRPITVVHSPIKQRLTFEEATDLISLQPPCSPPESDGEIDIANGDIPSDVPCQNEVEITAIETVAESDFVDEECPELSPLRTPATYCDICSKECYRPDFYANHCNGYSHKEKAGTLEPKRTFVSNKFQKFNLKLCTKCNKNISSQTFLRHTRSCKGPVTYLTCGTCQKDFTEKQLKKHEKKCKESFTGQPVGKENKNKKGIGVGSLFFLTFQLWCKYQVGKIIKHTAFDFINSYVVCNEAGINEHLHSHAIIETKKKMTYKQFKKAWKCRLKTRSKTKRFWRKIPKINDIQGVKNLKCGIKYCTKEDYRAIIHGFDRDYCSLIWKSYAQAQVFHRLSSHSYPFCNLIPSQQKVYKMFFDHFKNQVRQEQSMNRWDSIILRPWQIEVRDKLIEQNDREVLWVTDPEGNSGKTTLAKYFKAYFHTFYCHNGGTKDISYAYDDEKYVIIDLSRTCQERVNYEIMEHFKDGLIWSAKYESQCKEIDDVKVLVLSNFAPDMAKLTMNRWNIIELS